MTDTAPYFQRNRATLYQGDVLDVLRQMPSESVHCAITSPPYWGLRDYGTATWEGGDAECKHGGRVMGNANKGNVREVLDGDRQTCYRCGAHRIDQQIGLEATPGEYVERMVEVFGEVRRVLRNDGTLWLNLGDSYNAYNGNRGTDSEYAGQRRKVGEPAVPGGHGLMAAGLKQKDLIGIPWRVAFALQADGWWLRSDIIWAKPNPMPESVTDRPTKSHEYLFLLSKSATYHYDADAIREENTEPPKKCGKNSRANVDRDPSHGTAKQDAIGLRRYVGFNERYDFENPANGRNCRDVWTIATQPYSEAHFATFPEALVEPCIKAGTSERGVCPVCGAPWRRVVAERVKETRSPAGWKTGPGSHGDLTGHFDNREYDGKRRAEERQGAGRRMLLNAKAARDNGQPHDDMFPAPVTTGWQPTCTHDAEPVPAVCLDPFAGSATTLLVAQKLGRCGVGIELSREYADIAARRLSQEVLAW